GMGFGMMPMFAGVMELAGRGIVAVIAAQFLSFKGIAAANPAAWILADLLLIPSYIVLFKKLPKGRSESTAESAV
ncbi:MAG TPA: MATE family efflux transporter, partial [Lachnospiraceae bacterium]|nr:MATE family efflux transporter [Lachnospiraceae bacterium]